MDTDDESYREGIHEGLLRFMVACVESDELPTGIGRRMMEIYTRLKAEVAKEVEED